MNTEHELLLISQYDREARAREWYLNGQIKELRREVDELKSRLAD